MAQNMHFKIFQYSTRSRFRFLYKIDYNILTLKFVLFKISVKNFISIL